MAISPHKLQLSQSGADLLDPNHLFGPLDGDLIGEGSSDPRCPHFSAIHDDAAKHGVIHRFKGAVAWKAQRMHENVHGSKRRRVRPSSLCD